MNPGGASGHMPALLPEADIMAAFCDEPTSFDDLIGCKE
jgi:hypothetical protein